MSAICLSIEIPPLQAAEDPRVFELRTYVTHPGKLPDLLKRFREHTCRLFEKHGMQNIGYWVPTDSADGSENTLIYLIAHRSRESAKASWAAFQQDPEWQAAAKASEINGKILAQRPGALFLKTTDYSAPVVVGASPTERVFEMRTYKAASGKLPELHQRFRNHTTALFQKHGMTQIGYWSPTEESGGSADTLIYLLSHPSREAAQNAFTQFRADPQWIAAKAESEKNGSLTAVTGGVKSVFLKATDFSPIR
ncbi:MAG: hypothetical protein RLZZ399_1608 [Verrucomicrobiota bacterium]